MAATVSLTGSPQPPRSASIVNLPTDTLSGKLRTAIVATTKSNHHLSKPPKATEITREAMILSDPKRPIFKIHRDLEPSLKTENRSPETEEATPRVAYRSALTAEKARLLRKELRAAENWHDPMYHSAIASRLASPDDK